MAERRGHPRAPIELQVDYKKLNGFFADYTKNISKGGTFIKTQKPLPVGTEFHFRLLVPGRPEPFSLSGMVAHASVEGEEAGMGIRFAWADEARRREFEEEVERLMADTLGPELVRAVLGRPR